MRFGAGLALAGAAVVLGAGCAAPVQEERLRADGSRRQCFHADLVNGFKAIDKRTVDLTLGAREQYRVALVGTCPEVDDALRLAVRTRSGSGFICEDADVELIVPTQIGPRYCPATSIRKRSTTELDAERAARRRR